MWMNSNCSSRVFKIRIKTWRQKLTVFDSITLIFIYNWSTFERTLLGNTQIRWSQFKRRKTTWVMSWKNVMITSIRCLRTMLKRTRRLSNCLSKLSLQIRIKTKLEKNFWKLVNLNSKRNEKLKWFEKRKRLRTNKLNFKINRLKS